MTDRSELPQQRHTFPAERIEFHGRFAKCRYCKDQDGDPGMVGIQREVPTLTLQPDRCWCMLCGQRYYVVVEGDLEEWWRQLQEDE